MKEIIKELEDLQNLELKQIGLTPTSFFKGTQEEHDLIHLNKAKKYLTAISILKSTIQVRDWTSGDIY